HHDDDCTCGCHDHEEHEHHHHHDHEEHHHHDDDCTCGCHDHDHDHEHEHDHEGHHHADEVFTSFGAETAHKFESEKITQILTALQDENEYGMVLRAKGIVAASDGKWIHFDYVPGEPDVRFGTAEVTGRLCVIGKDIDEAKIKSLFEL
ncbi:MAG: GTP-binding protein, partial [Anaerovoracaceae bacterium]